MATDQRNILNPQPHVPSNNSFELSNKSYRQRTQRVFFKHHHPVDWNWNKMYLIFQIDKPSVDISDSRVTIVTEKADKNDFWLLILHKYVWYLLTVVGKLQYVLLLWLTTIGTIVCFTMSCMDFWDINKPYFLIGIMIL